MTYPLAALAKRAGVRRKRVVLRPIEVTAAQENELLRVVVQPVQEWARQWKDVVGPAYERAVSSLTQDNEADDLRIALTQAEAAVVAATVGLSDETREWLVRLLAWHTRRWVASVKAGTGVDVFPFIDLAANQVALEAMLARITSLIRDVGEAVRKDVAEIVWRGVLERQPYRITARQIADRMGVARRRARFIAADQANKVAASLTQIRQEEAGIERFEWRATMDLRTRPEHAALHGQIFAWDKPPSIGRPGEPPRCRCSALAVLDLE